MPWFLFQASHLYLPVRSISTNTGVRASCQRKRCRHEGKFRFYHLKQLTEHAGLLGVDITNGGLLVAVFSQSRSRNEEVALGSGNDQPKTISTACTAYDGLQSHLLAVELELLILRRLDRSVLGERTDDGNGLVEFGFDRHDLRCDVCKMLGEKSLAGSDGCKIEGGVQYAVAVNPEELDSAHDVRHN